MARDEDENEDPRANLVALDDEEQDALWCDERERAPGRPEGAPGDTATRDWRASTEP